MKPFPNFKSLTTHHCVTGSMRHIYVYNDHPLSEDMLLGIGGGVGFMYWQMKDAPPFIGGRGKSRPKDAFETCIGERTGVHIQDFTTSSLRKAEASMLSMLEAGQPVMLQVDMGYLPYFDFGGEEYHFGGHYIVACGYNPETKMVLVADREDQLHTVPLDDVMKARSSRFLPFAPNNRWFSFDFSHKRAPTAEEVRQAITEQVEGMLNPPITNFGVKGIRKAAKRSLKWPEALDQKTLRFTMFNTYIFIAPDGGTGGGIFRYMFSRFLKEAAQVTGETSLVDIAKDFKQIGDRWQEAAGLFRQGWEERDPNEILPETSRLMLEIADLEEVAWGALGAAIK